MKTLYLFVIVLFISLYACDSPQQHTTIVSLKGFDSDILTNGEDLKIDSFFIVPLEITDSCLISDVQRIKILDSLIFVQDEYDQLLCFGTSGKLKQVYGKKGVGPGEHLNVITFFFNRKEQTVNLIDKGLSRITSFNIFTGELVSEKKYPIGTLSQIDETYLLDDYNMFCSNYLYNKINFIYSIFNLETYDIQKLESMPMETKNIVMPIGIPPISAYQDSLKCIVPFSDQIYLFKNNKLTPLYQVETQMPMIPEEEIKKIKNFGIEAYARFKNQHLFTGFTGICETSKYLCLQILFNVQYFLVDKQTNTGKLYKYPVEKEVEHLPLIKIMAANDDWLIGTDSYFRLKDIAKRIPEDTPDPNCLKMKQTIDNMGEEDNPYLFFYRLK